MERDVAQVLADELCKRWECLYRGEERGELANLLSSVEVPESSRFYVEVQDNSKTISETGRYFNFYVRRILRNRNAKGYEMSTLKGIYNNMISFLAHHPSAPLTRSIRLNQDLVDMMDKCEYPYSLLCRFEASDHDNPEERLFRETRPVLVIPGVEDIAKINAWENTHKKYEEAKGIFGIFRPIKHEEYLRFVT
ncbi:hypothetical protein KY345_06785 [Candidatus Woesearchaeota archaeon]|nr:hypothetical protein [Candidatus Woesearchaeota archaeon]